MKAIPFIGAAYTGRSDNVDAQRCVNLYLEADKDGKNPMALYGTPGTELFAYLSAYPVRGMHVVANILYVVNGDKLNAVFTNGTFSLVGTLTTTSGRVSMADNGTQLIIVDGATGWIYTPSTGVFAQITAAGFPIADVVTFLDGYFIANKQGTDRFQISGLYDGSTWDALDIATAEGDPDNIVTLIADHRELWVFSDMSTEVYYNSGDADFPFARIQGAFIETGCAARWSVAKCDNSLFWLSHNKQGHGMVVRANGYAPQIISTRAIEYKISTYASIADAFGYSYVNEGHSFYVLTFPSANATWVYDAATNAWHERSSRNADGVNGRHLSDSYAFFAGHHIVGDYADGDVYKMKMDVYTDGIDAYPIRRVRAGQHISKDGRKLRIGRVQVDLEAGVGLVTGQGSDPQAMLRWSDDGGHTWSAEHWASFGKIGEYGQRAVWRRLGSSRDRIFEISISDPVKVVVQSMYADIDGGGD